MLDQDQVFQLAKLLHNCQQARQNRTRIVEKLPSEITTPLGIGDGSLGDLVDVVTRCNQFEGGVKKLVEAVRFFEGNTFSMQQVDRWTQNILSGSRAVQEPCKPPPESQIPYPQARDGVYVESTPPLGSQYITFEVSIGNKDNAGYPVRVHHNQVVPSAQGTFSLDPGIDPARSLIQAINENKVHNQDILGQFGALLFEKLFAGQIGQSFFESRGRAEQDGLGLRLRLDIEAPELAVLPWEYLGDQVRGDIFAIDPQKPLTRYVSLLNQSLDVIQVQDRLRLLLVLASPQDTVPLAMEQNKQTILDALHDVPGIQVLPVIEHATRSSLSEALRQHAPHIVHLIGHGYFETDTQTRAGIVLEEGGKSKRIPADEFSRLFQPRPGRNEYIRLVVLDSCEGARITETQPLVGVAQNVLRFVPAVIAMQHPIFETSARCFAYEFYRAIAVGYPVDAAVSEARKALYIDVGSSQRDWGTPVLFMRSDDGQLFSRARRPKESRGSILIPERSELRQALFDCFSEEELRALCFDLEVEYTQLPGQGKAAKIRDLINYMERHGQLARLVAEIQRQRPHIVWMNKKDL